MSVPMRGTLLLDAHGRIVAADGIVAQRTVADRIVAAWLAAGSVRRTLFGVEGAGARLLVAVALTTPDSTVIAVMQGEDRDPLFEFVTSVDFAQDVLTGYLSDMLTVVDRHGVLRYVSPVHERFFNLKPGSGIGRHVTEVIENTRLHEVAATGQGEVAALHELRGVTRVISRRAVRDRQGRIVGATGHVMTTGPEQLRAMAAELSRLKSEVAFYRRELDGMRNRTYGLDQLVGDSAAMQRLKRELVRVAPLDVPVLLTGESGTGKELAAHAIHRLSLRRSGAMVMVNAAALPPTLVESELFGYEPGSFTGAERKGRQGKIEQADGGTLFFDEVGDMPADVQVKLLRVLQDGSFQRVGGSAARHSDFRLVSASNRDFDAMIQEGTFRLDLFYRIGGVTLRMPSLAERLEDLPRLAQLALEQFAQRHGQRPKRISTEAIAYLRSRPWPGNVRQLMHAVERAAIFCDQEVIEPADFGFAQPRGAVAPAQEPAAPPAVAGPADAAPSPRVSSAVEAVKSQMIRDAMARHQGNKTRVAAELGISRSYLYKRLARLGIGHREGD